MSLRLSRQTFLPVVVLAVLGGVVATFMLTRLPQPTDSSQSTLVRPKSKSPVPARKPVVKKAAPAPAAKPRAQAAPKPKAPAKPAARVPARPKPGAVVPATPAAPVRKPEPKPVVENGLPQVLKAALTRNRVVVVALYDPAAGLDKMALSEARDGAKAAGVGFLAVNVFQESVSRMLVQELGALESPSVLVFERPETLFARIDGFVDRDSVAQAAANALR